MNQEPLFISKQEQNEILNQLFEQRKKWFIHSLSTAVESVTSDQFVYQMFQTPSTKSYISDRVCEIVTQSIEDDRELFINELFNFLSQKVNLFDLEEFEKVGSELLNLSTKQIQIEIEQRNQIRQLTTSNDQNYKNNKKNYKNILKKLKILNSLCLTMAQEMRAFKRRFPILLSKYKALVNSTISDYLLKVQLKFNNLKSKNKILKSENLRLNQINENLTKEVARLHDSLKKYEFKYQELQNEKSQNDSRFESYLDQLKSTQKNLEKERNENIDNLKEKLNEQLNENETLKKQIKILKQQITKEQQEINQLNQTIQNNEDVISNKIQDLIVSQKVMTKLKDEFEKVSFILSEIKKIKINDQSDEIINKIKFIKSKIKSKQFEIETINELKENCLHYLVTKDKIKENLNKSLTDLHSQELSTLIKICTNFTLQKELHEILLKLNEKFKINSENNETIEKLLKQLNKKTKENQRLSIVNQKLQCQNDELRQQIGEIKMHVRSNPSLSPYLTNSSRILFSPSKSQNNFSRKNIDVNRTPKNYTRSDIIDINNHTFDDSESSENKMNDFSEDSDGDDEGENDSLESEILYEIKSRKKKFFTSKK